MKRIDLQELIEAAFDEDAFRDALIARAEEAIDYDELADMVLDAYGTTIANYATAIADSMIE